MGLKLEWTAFDDGSGAFANAGGLRLIAGKGGRWSVVALGNVDVSNHAPTLAAAQEAAEAATARLLAEDAGVRALLGLRWIPVTERLPEESLWVVGWSQPGEFHCYLKPGGGWHCEANPWRRHTEPPTHWRPLPDGPEVPT